MKKILSWITKNWIAKTISLAMAVLVWVLINNQIQLSGRPIVTKPNVEIITD